MKTNQPRSKIGGERRLARAFTMVEIMFAVLIIGILLGLLIGSVKLVTRMSKRTVDRQAVLSIRAGGVQFKQLFGFDVPLVRERGRDPNPGAHTYVRSGANNIVCVYKPSDLDYLEELQGEELAGLQATDSGNPFIDYRFSERSIPIYLVGELDIPALIAQPTGVPIDGIQGPGFYKPTVEGTFEIPADVLNPRTGPSATKRAGTTYESLIALNSNGPTLFVDPNAPKHDVVEVRDRNGVAIRYYRWEHGPVQANGTLPLNVPALVGRYFVTTGLLANAPVPPDRDISNNANIRAATFAIVAAGPDGVFGDEPGPQGLELICQKLGVPYDTSNEVKIRLMAELDNIVEVGQ
jgi:hypothetical protein